MRDHTCTTPRRLWYGIEPPATGSIQENKHGKSLTDTVDEPIPR